MRTTRLLLPAIGVCLIGLVTSCGGPTRAEVVALEQRVAWLEGQLHGQAPAPVVAEGETGGVAASGAVETGAYESEAAIAQADPQADPQVDPFGSPAPAPAPGGSLLERVDALIGVTGQTRTKVDGIDERLSRIETKFDVLADKIESKLDDKPTPTVRPGRPDPALRYRVPLAGANLKGPSDAKVTVVIFSDFQCPFCKRVTSTLDEVERHYKGQVRFAFKHNPLAFHKEAEPAARAAEAAARQGKFWEMHDLLFANNRQLNEDNFLKWAGELKLDISRFKKDLRDEDIDSEISRDQKDATRLGARGTPAFFVNGRFLSGAQPFEKFRQLIDEEMKEAERRIAAGTARAQVYDALMKDAKSGV